MGQEEQDDGTVDYKVLGTRGVEYTVHLCQQPTCDCPDYLTRQLRCKHILFVLRRVLGLNANVASKRSYTSAEIQTFLDNAPASVLPPQTSQDDQQPEIVSVEQRPLSEDGTCPMCYEEMHPDRELIIYCKRTCGHNMHSVCFARWVQQRRQSGYNKIDCPMCRSVWLPTDWEVCRA